MAIVTLDVTGQILHPDLTPAVGTVTFQIPHDLNDIVDNVTYGPGVFVGTLDVAGNFTITGLIATDSPDITETWMYRVHVSTDAYVESFSTSLPAALAPVAEFADLIPAQVEPCTDDGSPCASLAQLAALQVEVDAVEADVAALEAVQGDYVLKAGDTMTGDLDISGALLHVSETIGTNIGSPLFDLLFTTNPAVADPNLLEVALNNNPALLATWLNEAGRYRAEQQAPIGFDHLITLIASFASSAGNLIQFERRDAGNVRVQMGAIDRDGRLMTSLYPFTAITNIDPGATGKYTAQVAALVELPGVRRNFDDEVRIRGRIAVTAAGPVAGDVIMVIPAGFIPSNQQWLSVTTTTGIAVPCEIMTSGNVVCRRTQAGATNLCFENFTYKTS